MTEREIRAMLRGAVRKGILYGWYSVGVVGDRQYIVNPGPPIETSTYGHRKAEEYCRMLKQAGVDPVYRESEPHDLP